MNFTIIEFWETMITIDFIDLNKYYIACNVQITIFISIIPFKESVGNDFTQFKNISYFGTIRTIFCEKSLVYIYFQLIKLTSHSL